MKKHSSAESTIRTHQLDSVPWVVIRLDMVPLISTPNTVPNGVPTPPLSSVPPMTDAEIASISRPLALSLIHISCQFFIHLLFQLDQRLFQLLGGDRL